MENMSNDKRIRMSMELNYLAILYKKKLITDEERKRILEKIKESYGVVSFWEPPGYND